MRRRQRRPIDDPLEDKILGLLDWFTMKHGANDPDYGWSLAAALAIEGAKLMIDPKPGSPGKLDTGQRDLLLFLEMRRAKLEGRSYRQMARELAKEWQAEGLWQISGETVYRHYKRICKASEANASMKLAALELLTRVGPPRDLDALRNMPPIRFGIPPK